MSTTFGIIIGFDEDGSEDVVEVAFRTNGGVIYFTNPIAHLLPDHIEVEALDNDPQGIHTIGGIKREINGNISSKA